MKKILFTLAIAISLTSCTSSSNQKDEALRSLSKNNLTLTDELVVNYIKAYKALKAQGPQLLDQINKKDGNPEGTEAFQEIEKTLKESGFKDYPEFVKTNAKVAWAFSLQQADAFMNDMDAMKNDGLAQIEEQLKNPDVPAEVKEQLLKAKEEIVATNAKNSKWANVSLDIVNRLVNEEDKAVIKKHAKELTEAFVGASMPEMPEGM